MDDFILLAKTKKDCINLKIQIEEFLKNDLHLSLNEKSKYYPYSMGVNFCGYRIFTTHKLLRNRSKKKINKKVTHWNKLYAKKQLNFKQTIQSLNAWINHSNHCNSYKLQQNILNKCNFLITNKTYEALEKELINLIENAEI